MATDDLFMELRTLRFEPGSKDSHHENLLDVLEICAVASGRKPAHLNGQGLRSADLLAQLEHLAPRHNLLTLRSHPLISGQYRAPRIEPSVAEFMRNSYIAALKTGPNVLWVYREPAIRELIEAATSASEDLARALGYPPCCVEEESEFHIQMAERYATALREQ